MKNLILRENEIDDQQVHELTNILHLTCIEHLDLSHNSITNKGLLDLIIALADCRVTTLNLEDNFFQPDSFLGIHHLNLEKNIEKKAEILSKLHIALRTTKIDKINFSGNELSN